MKCYRLKTTSNRQTAVWRDVKIMVTPHPPSKNRCTIVVFPRMNSLYTEDFWERTHDNCDGKILRVTTIERFFCFRPLAFATQINNLL